MRTSCFAILDLEPRFALALDQLERAYRAVAARVHPDRYVSATAREQREAMVLAADVNEAYHTLRKVAPRAQHLLSLRGVDVNTIAASASSAFLSQQLEWRETLAAARESGDKEALHDLRRTARECMALLHSRLETELDVRQDNISAAQSVQELMYTERLSADIDDAYALLEV